MIDSPLYFLIEHKLSQKCNKSEHKCYKVIKQEYNPKDSNSFKYCREFEILDKFRLSMDNLDCKIHIIKKE